MPRFQWDSAKNALNLRKHKADFSLAPVVWSDPHLAIVYDRFEGGEHRYHAVGMIGSVCLIVVHTYPDPTDEDDIRVIGLRKATSQERRRYEEASD